MHDHWKVSFNCYPYIRLCVHRSYKAYPLCVFKANPNFCHFTSNRDQPISDGFNDFCSLNCKLKAMVVGDLLAMYGAFELEPEVTVLQLLVHFAETCEF